jgi:hypothetical protein
MKEEVWGIINSSKYVSINDNMLPTLTNEKYISFPKEEDEIICLYEPNEIFKVLRVNKLKNNIDCRDSHDKLRTFSIKCILTKSNALSLYKEITGKEHKHKKTINEKCILHIGDYFISKRKGYGLSGLYLTDYKGNNIDKQLKFKSIGDFKKHYKIEKITTKGITLKDFKDNDKNIIKVWKFIVEK